MFKRFKNKVKHRFYLYLDKKERRKKKYLDYIEINISEHCNLNCAYCSHFAPVSEEYFYDFEKFKIDIKRIAELTSSKLDFLRIMGGEPLLNKQCKDYLSISREYFPNTEIILVTNGILLKEQSSSFYQICKENNIKIECTKYPIKIDYEDLTNFVREKGVSFHFASAPEKIPKFFQRLTLCQKGNIKYINSYLPCFWPMRCTTLRNGKIYLCPIVANIHIINKHFNTKFNVSEKDYIDIYKVKNIKEILKFLHKKIPFCRYCDFSKPSIAIWTISKKELSEWVKE